MGNLLDDIRYGIRMLLKHPGFTTIAVLVLALGIGANTAIFALVNSMLLRPILAESPEELVAVYSKNTARPGYRSFSYPNFQDIRDSDVVFTDLMAHNLTMIGVADGEVTRRVFAEIASADYFDTFGVEMFRGRAFSPAEEAPGSAVPVVIVSYEHWRRNGEDPDLVGKTLRVNGQALSIVGIAPRNFTGRTAIMSLEIYLPFGLYDLMISDMFSEDGLALGDRDHHNLFLVGRLRPGLSYEEADAQLALVASRMGDAFPAINRDQTFVVGPLSRVGISTNPENDDEIAVLASVLMAMAGIVLLIACINLANMLLARGATRHKEFAVRVAIGAGRGRVLRQLLTEGLMLAVMGSIAGLLIAYWANSMLAASMNEILVMSAMSMDIVIHAAPDYRVLSATAAFCVVATVLFGLGPAWKLSRPDVMADLKEQVGELQERGRGGKVFGRRNLLVVSQIALSLVLLTAAGLFVRGAVKAADVDPGFSLDNGLIVEIDPSLVGYDEVRSRDLYRRLYDRLANIPGVESTSVAATVPFGNVSSGEAVRRAEDLPGSGASGEDEIEAVSATSNIVGADYFTTLGLPIMRGRPFSRSEAETDGGPRVAIVDETLAERLWPDEDPLGRQIGFGRDPADRGTNDMEVVGVVPTIRDDLFASGPEPHVYVPHGQDFQSGMNIHIKTSPMDEVGVAATL